MLKPKNNQLEFLANHISTNILAPHCPNVNMKENGGEHIKLEFNCLYFTHNEKGFDENPSAWAFVYNSGGVTSGCWVCHRPQILKVGSEHQPAPTLRTLSGGDERLIKTLLELDCSEVGLGENGERYTPEEIVKLSEEARKKIHPAVEFPVVYDDGSKGYHFRIAVDGKNKWRHKAGGSAKKAVFGLHSERVKGLMKEKGFVIITESPLDAAVLIAAGFPAIAVLGKNNAAAVGMGIHKEALEEMMKDGNFTIFVWQEPDAEGFAQTIANQLGCAVECITPPSKENKDAYRLLRECNYDWEKFTEIIEGLCEESETIQPQEQEKNEKSPNKHVECEYCSMSDKELFKLALPILKSQNPVEEAARRIRIAYNIVYDIESTKLLMLAIQTRLLKQPTHTLVVGTSGSGKSNLVSAVVNIVPPCHLYDLVGFSERALVYHKIPEKSLIYLTELRDFQENSVGATILRQVLWKDNTKNSNKSQYFSVTFDRGKVRRLRLEVPYQICLITTRVKEIEEEQLATRIMVAEIIDNEDRHINIAWLGGYFDEKFQPFVKDADADISPVVAFGELAQRFNWEVRFPYARALRVYLSKLPRSERDYRDWRHISNLIYASAIWNILHRTHWVDWETKTVYVLAEMEDYLIVRELINRIYSRLRNFGLSENQAKVWECLKEKGDWVTVKELAEELKLADKTIRLIVDTLMKKGLVEKKKEGRQNFYKHVDGADVEVLSNILPTAEQLLETHATLDSYLTILDQDFLKVLNFNPDPIPPESERLTFQKLFGDGGDEGDGGGCGDNGSGGE